MCVRGVLAATVARSVHTGLRFKAVDLYGGFLVPPLCAARVFEDRALEKTMHFEFQYVEKHDFLKY